MNSDQKIGVSLLVGLVGFALALGFGRKPVPLDPSSGDDLTTAESAFTPEIVERSNPFAPASEASQTGWQTEQRDADVDERLTLAAPDDLASKQTNAESRLAPQPTGWDFLEAALEPEDPSSDAALPSQPVATIEQTTASQHSGEEPPTAAAASGEKPTAEPPAFRRYVVQSGDTLSGIAERECGRVGSYFELYEANEDTLESPNDLRVGQTLRIPLRLAVSPAARTR